MSSIGTAPSTISSPITSAPTKQARLSKRFVELLGGHNDAFTVDRDAYVAALREFEAGLGKD